ncbi:MAG: metallophosphoesterase [Oscillospiraceae bacterium]|nr:metallophosphoesterase [Oscillospiraceae bacterium]
MKILLLADEPSKSLWDYYDPKKMEGIELIISCGDLDAAYLEFLVTMWHCPVLYVPGNHDEAYKDNPPEGCDCIDGSMYIYKGLRIFGMGGSMKYKPGTYMYSEQAMRRRLWLSKRMLWKFGGIDIFVTHAPARGYGDLDDLPHQGFACFNELLQICKPKLMAHGHVHASYGKGFQRESQHPSGTTIVNAFEKYIIDLDEEPVKVDRKELRQGLTGAFLPGKSS